MTLYEYGTFLLIPVQEQAPSFRWAYLWLAAGGFVLLLAALAFVYLLARRHTEWPDRFLSHPHFVRVDGLLSKRMPSLWVFIRRRLTVREWHGLTLTVAAVLVFGTIYVFWLITESSVEKEALYVVDQTVYLWFLEAMHPQMTASMQALTHLGDSLTVACLSVIVGAWLLSRREWWDVIALGLAVGVGAGIMTGLKWIFERTRPIEQLAAASGHSFPSGHAFMGVTLYGFLIYLVWKKVENDGVRIGATMLLTLIILCIGLSRVMLRVHWVSDVAGGLTLGVGWLVCAVTITRALRAYLTGS